MSQPGFGDGKPVKSPLELLSEAEVLLEQGEYSQAIGNFRVVVESAAFSGEELKHELRNLWRSIFFHAHRNMSPRGDEEGIDYSAAVMLGGENFSRVVSAGHAVGFAHIPPTPDELEKFFSTPDSLETLAKNLIPLDPRE